MIKDKLNKTRLFITHHNGYLWLFVLGIMCYCIYYKCFVETNDALFTIFWISLSLLIFGFQEIYSYKSNLDKKDLLDEIGKNVLEIRPFKEAFDIIPTLKIWRSRSEEHNIFIFYFPYTLCPGFWIDGGHEFIQYLDSLEAINDNECKDNYIFIGPSKLDTSIVEKIIKKLDEEDTFSRLQSQINSKLANEVNCSLPIDKSVFIEKVRNLYNDRLEHISKIKSKKKFICTIDLDNSTNKNLLSSSFVIKINKKDQDVFFIDTFNTLTTNLPKLSTSLGVNSILDDKRFDLLFKNPTGKLINNDKISNLFLSMFLESFNNQELNDKLFNNIIVLKDESL